MVGSRPRPPVRSAAAIRSSATRYARRSAGTVSAPVQLEVALGAGRQPGLAGGQHPPLVRVGHQVVAERRRRAEHRDQSPAQPVVAVQRVEQRLGRLVRDDLAGRAGDPAAVAAGRGPAGRLDQPVQLAQRQVGVGGPGQRLEQLGRVGAGRALRLGVPQPQPVRAEQVGRAGAVVGEAVPGEPAGPGHRVTGRAAAGYGRCRRRECRRRAACPARARRTGPRTAATPPRRRPGPRRSAKTHRLGVVAQLVEDGGVVGRPPLDHRGVALDVELQAPGPVAEPERLVRVAAGGGQQHRPERQLGDLVAVPLDHVGQQRHPLEQRVGVGRVALADQARADLRARGAALDQPAVRAGEQLAAEADRRASAPGAGPPCAAAPPRAGNHGAPGVPSACRVRVLVAAEHDQRQVVVERSRAARRPACGRSTVSSSPASVSHSPSRRRSSVGSFSMTSAVPTPRGYRLARAAGSRRQPFPPVGLRFTALTGSAAGRDHDRVDAGDPGVRPWSSSSTWSSSSPSPSSPRRWPSTSTLGHARQRDADPGRGVVDVLGLRLADQRGRAEQHHPAHAAAHRHGRLPGDGAGHPGGVRRVRLALRRQLPGRQRGALGAVHGWPDRAPGGHARARPR